MDIQIASLCDFAADYNGKLVVSGTFDTLVARAVPGVHPQCALALRFWSGSGRAIGNRKCRFAHA